VRGSVALSRCNAQRPNDVGPVPVSKFDENMPVRAARLPARSAVVRNASDSLVPSSRGGNRLPSDVIRVCDHSRLLSVIAGSKKTAHDGLGDPSILLLRAIIYASIVCVFFVALFVGFDNARSQIRSSLPLNTIKVGEKGKDAEEIKVRI